MGGSNDYVERRRAAVGSRHTAELGGIVTARCTRGDRGEHMGRKFQEYDSDSAVMVVLESPTPLGDDAKRYYTALVNTDRRCSA